MKVQPQTFKALVTFEQREKVPTEFGYTSRSLGQVTHEVAVVIDVQAIADQLGRKAYESKGKRASVSHGAVVVRALTLNPVK